jgi:hypothetical protein
VILELNTKIIKNCEICKLFFKKFLRVSLIGLELPIGSDPIGFLRTLRLLGDFYNP